MAHHDGHTIEVSDPGTVQQNAGNLANTAMVAGAVGLLAAGLFASTGQNWERFLFSYLHNLVFVLGIAIGALGFILIQHVTRAGWSSVVRRLAEVLTLLFVPIGMLFLFIVFLVLSGNDQLYQWNNYEWASNNPHVKHKMIYLNPTWFTIRAIMYFAFWIGTSWWYLSTSAKQDETGDPKLTLKMGACSPICLILYGASLTFATVDWVMSLDAEWFSTIIGVYFFANSAVSFYAMLAIVVFLVNKQGLLTKEINAEHRHDIGKLLFGFNCFWAYIAFSQYLLYWYANIPEETVWYARRQENGWEVVSMILIVGHFVIPFLGLMSRTVKRHPVHLTLWAAYLLLMCWIDIYWLVMPEHSPEGPGLTLIDIGCLLGVVGFTGFGMLKLAGDYSLLAKKDPRLQEALHFHNI